MSRREHDYEVVQVLHVAATTQVRATSAREAVRLVEEARGTEAAYMFEFDIPHRETRLTARRLPARGEADRG